MFTLFDFALIILHLLSLFAVCSLDPIALQDTQDRLTQEEDARNQLFQAKKKLEQELSGFKKDIEDLELALQKVLLSHFFLQ